MCRHPRNRDRASYVVGKADETLAVIMRSTGACGPQAQLFYPRQSELGAESMAARDNRPKQEPVDGRI